MNKIFKIVLTGGPCGGKTASMTILKEFLEQKGYKVYTIPEVATLASNNGVNLGDPGSENKFFAFANLMMALESTMEAWAKESNRDCVILSDRGIMDIKAYTPTNLWPQYLASRNWDESDLREGRYDAVFHLVSAAVGAPDFYNHDNPARWETLTEAVDADRRTQEAWVGHPHLRIIDNSTDFPNKISRLCHAVGNFISSDHKEIERRFLVKREDLSTVKQLISKAIFDVTQTYLQTNDGTVARIRRRGAGGKAIYTYTTKSPKEGATCTEIERRITAAEYDVLWQQHDTTRQTVYKRRYCFIWENKQFELDEFVNPETGLLILEVELDSENEKIDLPPFLSIEKEITTDSAYSNWSLAKYERNDAVATNQ